MASPARAPRQFYRACPQHLSEVIGHATASGGEIVRCAEGHVCPEWLIMDHRGYVVGMGRIGKPGILLSGILDKGKADPDDLDISDEACLRKSPSNVVKFTRR